MDGTANEWLYGISMMDLKEMRARWPDQETTYTLPELEEVGHITRNCNTWKE
jgi:hypothetical protein